MARGTQALTPAPLPVEWRERAGTAEHRHVNADEDDEDLEGAAVARPMLRGVSHLLACIVSVVVGLMVVWLAPGSRHRLAACIYCVSLVAMFGSSALYHLLPWRPPLGEWMRRLDHAAIFVFIAGSYTPFCLLALHDGSGEVLLTLVWIGAGLGVLQSLLWVRAPRAVAAALYVGLGWLVLPYVSRLAAVIGWRSVALLAAGGICFTVGALVYALRRPDPVPAIFGYHEVFHALVIAGCALQFGAVCVLVCPPG